MYLQDILAKGKKNPLGQPLPSVLSRLKEGLQQYIDYKSGAARENQAHDAALQLWAKAVVDAAHSKLQLAAARNQLRPQRTAISSKHCLVWPRR